MTDPTTIAEREPTGRFVNGHKSISPGRPKGSRSKLGEAFVEDLRDAWEVHGASVIDRVAMNEPGTLLKVIAGLLPKDINLSVGVDPASFVEKFRAAYAMLGNEPPARLPKPPMRVVSKP